MSFTYRSVTALGTLAVVALLAFIYWPLPAELNLDVPFTDQAPPGKWDRNEDCEEASIAMAQAYLTSDTESLLPSAGATSYISRLRV